MTNDQSQGINSLSQRHGICYTLAVKISNRVFGGMVMIKRSFITALIIAMLLVLSPPMQQTASAQGFQISFGFFYHRLAPYGRWVFYRPHGWVWYPAGVGPYWQPYADDGYWANTEYGYTWVSNYEWGWIPFHYGSWTWVDAYGWIWVPGYVWGPAWVTWSYGPDYIGWAPLPPDFAFTYGYGCPTVSLFPGAWVFVSIGYFGHPHFWHYRVPVVRNIHILNITQQVTNITIVNNYVTNPGPPVSHPLPGGGGPVRSRIKEMKAGDLSLSPQPIREIEKNPRISIASPRETSPVRDQKGPSDPYSPRRGSDVVRPDVPGEQPKGYTPRSPKDDGSYPGSDPKGAPEKSTPRSGSLEPKPFPPEYDRPRKPEPVAPARPEPYYEPKPSWPSKGTDPKGGDYQRPPKGDESWPGPRQPREYKPPQNPAPAYPPPSGRKYEAPRSQPPSVEKQPRYIPYKPAPAPAPRSQPQMKWPQGDSAPPRSTQPAKPAPQPKGKW
jgi:hypothetical protein